MSEAIVVALITGGLSLLGTYIANRKSQALIQYRIDELTLQVQKHNQVIDRTYKLETEVARIEDENNRQNHRLDELERRDAS